jgi:hypothetical protein
MRHPTTFGAVYAQSPCCLGIGAFEYDEGAWRAALQLQRPEQLRDTVHPMTNVLVGLAAAFSPNPNRPPFYFVWPFKLVEGVRRPLEPDIAGGRRTRCWNTSSSTPPTFGASAQSDST